jgi:hypothetical protein
MPLVITPRCRRILDHPLSRVTTPRVEQATLYQYLLTAIAPPPRYGLAFDTFERAVEGERFHCHGAVRK